MGLLCALVSQLAPELSPVMLGANTHMSLQQRQPHCSLAAGFAAEVSLTGMARRVALPDLFSLWLLF